MAVLKNRSLFYYGFTTLEAVNTFLDFSEGGPALFAEIEVGARTLTDHLQAVQSALIAAGGQSYAVTVDRKTRLVTVSADDPFQILAASGISAGAASAWTLLGFTVDKTGANSYTGNLPAGFAYETQRPLQSYIAPEDFEESVSAVLNEAANGDLETVTFGRIQKVQMEIDRVTDIPQPIGGDIKNNPNGVANLREFMKYLTLKRPVEFMESVITPEIFHAIRLDSTPDSQTGTGFQLKEEFAKGLPYYFRSGILTFRVL